MKEINWTGANSYNLEDFEVGNTVIVSCETLYYSSLLRFLYHLKRQKDVKLILTPEMEETAEITGFSNLI